MGKKLDEIRHILKEHDVRDPRGALVAISNVLIADIIKDKAAKPLITAQLFANVDGKGGEVHVTINKARPIEPKHLVTLIDALGEFGNEKFGECPGCENCQPELEGKELKLDPAFLEVLRGIAAKLKVTQANKKEGE